jgi:hypothetical protein
MFTPFRQMRHVEDDDLVGAFINRIINDVREGTGLVVMLSDISTRLAKLEWYERVALSRRKCAISRVRRRAPAPAPLETVY